MTRQSPCILRHLHVQEEDGNDARSAFHGRKYVHTLAFSNLTVSYPRGPRRWPVNG